MSKYWGILPMPSDVSDADPELASSRHRYHRREQSIDSRSDYDSEDEDNELNQTTKCCEVRKPSRVNPLSAPATNRCDLTRHTQELGKQNPQKPHDI